VSPYKLLDIESAGIAVPWLALLFIRIYNVKIEKR